MYADQINKLKKEKQDAKKKLEEENGRVTHLQGVVSDLHEKFRQKDELETIRRLEAEITELEAQIKQQEEELTQSRAETEALKTEEHETHERIDEGIQVDIPTPTTEEEPVEEQNASPPTEQVEDEDEDEESFVYQGVDTPADEPAESTLVAPPPTAETEDVVESHPGTDEGSQTLESGATPQQDIPRPSHIDEVGLTMPAEELANMIWKDNMV